MSAFIVSEETISGMMQAITRRISPRPLLYYYWNDEAYYFSDNSLQIAQKLLDENYRSINYRYGEENDSPEFQPKYVRELSPVEIIKLCHCYRYQSCETPDWEETEAFAIYDALREAAIYALPGYDEAEWELPRGNLNC